MLLQAGCDQRMLYSVEGAIISGVMIPRGAHSNNKRGSSRHRSGEGWPLPTKSTQIQCAVPKQGPGGFFCAVF